jgi:hypothetical protein
MFSSLPNLALSLNRPISIVISVRRDSSIKLRHPCARNAPQTSTNPRFYQDHSFALDVSGQSCQSPTEHRSTIPTTAAVSTPLLEPFRCGRIAHAPLAAISGGSSTGWTTTEGSTLLYFWLKARRQESLETVENRPELIHRYHISLLVDVSKFLDDNDLWTT